MAPSPVSHNIADVSCFPCQARHGRHQRGHRRRHHAAQPLRLQRPLVLSYRRGRRLTSRHTSHARHHTHGANLPQGFDNTFIEAWINAFASWAAGAASFIGTAALEKKVLIAALGEGTVKQGIRESAIAGGRRHRDLHGGDARNHLRFLDFLVRHRDSNGNDVDVGKEGPSRARRHHRQANDRYASSDAECLGAGFEVVDGGRRMPKMKSAERV